MLLAASVVLSGCSLLTGQTQESSDEQTGEAEDGETTQSLPAEDGADETLVVGEDGEATEEEVVDVVIDMSNFEFSIDEIEAEPGQTLTVELTNSQGTHNFYIDELDVQSETIQSGEETMVTIQIPEDAESGTEYAFYCAIGNHQAQGMEGTLTVM